MLAVKSKFSVAGISAAAHRRWQAGSSATPANSRMDDED